MILFDYDKAVHLMEQWDVPGFIARSRQNPQSIAKSHHDWNRLFERQDS